MTYPVKGRKGVRGWMGSLTHQAAVAMGQRFVKATHGPAHLLEWTESRDHQLMALGVVLYHLNQQAVTGGRLSAA